MKHVEPLFLYKKFLKSLGYLTIGILGCLGFCLFTHTGSVATIQLINDFTSYHIHYSDFQGSLGNRFQFSHLDVTSPDKYALEIKAEKLLVEWQIFKLLENTLHIVDLKATHFEVIKKTLSSVTLESSNLSLETAANKDLKLIQQDINQFLPLTLVIQNAAFYDGQVTIDEQQQEIQLLKLSNFNSTRVIQTDSLDYIGYYGFIHAKHDDKLHTHWDLNWPEKFAKLYGLSGVKTVGDISLLIDDIDDHMDQVDATFEAKSFQHNQYDFHDFKITIQGAITNHDIKLNGVANHKPVQVALTGQWDDQTWTGQIRHAYVDDPALKSITKSYGHLTVGFRENWQVSADLSLLGQKIAGELIVYNRAPFHLAGEFHFHIKQLENLKSFFPALAKSQGHADGKITISGTMAKPTVLAQANVKKFNIPIPQYGVNAIIHNLSITKPKDKKLLISGNGIMSHGGTFTVNGTADFQSDFKINLQLSGQDLVVSNTPEYYIVASPELLLTRVNDAPKLTGHIFVSKANINRLSQVKKASRSSDIVVKSQHKKAKSRQTSYRSLYQDLRITLGDEIFYKDKGLTSRITGQLHLKQKPDNIPTLKGKLNLIDGTYKFQGRIFELTYGQLHFTGGPMNKPLLDIEAKQKVLPNFANKKSTMPTQVIDVGVKLSGEISEPRIQFFSTPNMSEADIMSYLVIGRPQSEASEAQAEMLFQAATQLSHMFGGKNTDFDLAKSLKLDHFELSKGDNSDSLEDTILTLGKQLSDRLYLNYSWGFLDSKNTIGLQYILAKNVHIEAQTGNTGRSADLVISFDTR